MSNHNKKSKRLKLKTSETWKHYEIVLFLLFIVALTSQDLFKDYTTDKLIIPLLFLAFALIFTIIQYRRLNFKKLQISCTNEQFQKAIKRTVNDLEWIIEKNNKNFIRAIRPGNLTASWGEMITIIKDNDQILINSVCTPNHISSAFSYGWNRKNISTFINNLTDVLNNKQAKTKEEKEINEWNSKRFAIRLITYPVCLLFIVFGIYIIWNTMVIKSPIAGLSVIVIACIYLYSDIKLLTAKK